MRAANQTVKKNTTVGKKIAHDWLNFMKMYLFTPNRQCLHFLIILQFLTKNLYTVKGR